ncbi:MAG: hypothetical protein P4L81_05220 [Candidatus Pacebacteria bacterium]|nr:hypothetical protein [Candidatus Paceibacterota bacterium]
MTKKILIIALGATLMPGLASAATPQTFGQLANQIVQLLGSATTDLIVLAIVIYFWGISSSLFKQGQEGRERLKEQLFWGIIVIFFAVSIWGIVQLVQNSFFGSNIGTTTSGTSAQTCTGLNCKFGQ